MAGEDTATNLPTTTVLSGMHRS